MPVSFVPSIAEVVRVLPEAILVIVATVIMVLAPLVKSKGGHQLGYFAVAGMLAALVGTVAAYLDYGSAFQSSIVVDEFATFFRALVIGVGVLTALASVPYLRREGAAGAEYYALLLYSVAGQCLMASSDELIMVFIGLEISSISSYILVGYLREDQRANEAAIKYFLLGSFATAFFLYGVAWIYGVTGTTYLSDIQELLAGGGMGPSPALAAVAAALIFVGIAFKVSVWPFQVWAPDVYQGAPAPVAGFLSAGPKAAAFAVFLRIFMSAFAPLSARWESLFWLSALLTMVVGNFAALAQTNVKRMLAYSSIAHAGYVLVALTANSEAGIAAAMFYLAAYALMNLGAFTMVAYFSRQGERYLEIQDLAGLAARRPVAAAVFSVFRLSQIGVPLTGGFFGKFYIFKAALDSGLIWLAVLGLLNSVVAAYYYLRILVVMYMQEPSEAASSVPSFGGAMGMVLWTAAIGTLLLGIYPSPVLDFASQAASLFLQQH
jgi:NADH-quinone oxidoreductase subunit N